MKDELEERKKCITCNKPLMAFQGKYLHIEEPCSGLLDYIEIEAIISDEFLHEKFEKLYGKPEINDYERIAVLEEKLKEATEENERKQKILEIPLVRFLLKFLKR